MFIDMYAYTQKKNVKGACRARQGTCGLKYLSPSVCVSMPVSVSVSVSVCGCLCVCACVCLCVSVTCVNMYAYIRARVGV
jgi:hypothetical protein